MAIKKENSGHKNIIPPKKGEIRNPNGRPKGSKNIRTILESFLNLELQKVNPITNEKEKLSVLELMSLVQIDNALKGDLYAFKEIIDRHEGKAINKTEITGKDGKDLVPARVLTKTEAKAFLGKLEDEC